MEDLLRSVDKVRMPMVLTPKTGQLSADQWQRAKEPPVAGLLELLEMKSAYELPLRAMLIADEHHIKVDRTGYPRCVRPRDPTLFSRIVTVADGFDAGTSKRSYQSVIIKITDPERYGINVQEYFA